MRTIKFRGYNQKHKKWLYGFYFENRGSGYIVDGEILDNPFHTPDDFDVDKESVGQSTGLFDKNGKEIYEGDIITVINKSEFKIWGESNNPFEVVWDGCCYSFDNGRTLFHFLENDGYETTVIGNKFENPELLSN